MLLVDAAALLISRWTRHIRVQHPVGGSHGPGQQDIPDAHEALFLLHEEHLQDIQHEQNDRGEQDGDGVVDDDRGYDGHDQQEPGPALPGEQQVYEVHHQDCGYHTGDRRGAHDDDVGEEYGNQCGNKRNTVVLEQLRADEVHDDGQQCERQASRDGHDFVDRERFAAGEVDARIHDVPERERLVVVEEGGHVSEQHDAVRIVGVYQDIRPADILEVVQRYPPADVQHQCYDLEKDQHGLSLRDLRVDDLDEDKRGHGRNDQVVQRRADFEGVEQREREGEADEEAGDQELEQVVIDGRSRLLLLADEQVGDRRADDRHDHVDAQDEGTGTVSAPVARARRECPAPERCKAPDVPAGQRTSCGP